MSLTSMIEVTHARAVEFADTNELYFFWSPRDVKCPECNAFFTEMSLAPFVEKRKLQVGESMNRLDAVLNTGGFSESARLMERWHATCFQHTTAPEFRRIYLGTTELPPKEDISNRSTNVEIIEWKELQQMVLDRTSEVLTALYALRQTLERQHAERLINESYQDRKKQKLAAATTPLLAIQDEITHANRIPELCEHAPVPISC